MLDILLQSAKDENLLTAKAKIGFDVDELLKDEETKENT